MFRLASIAGKSTHPRRAVVTGAGGGIGAALATQLATAGTALVLVDNNTDALARVAGRCSDLGVPVSSWDVDVADHAAVVEAVRHIVEDDGPPDALFNVAGLIHHGLLVDSDVADIQRIIQVDLLGTISCCQALLPALATHARARIVNVSSAFGLVGVAGYSAYNAAKFAVRGFTEALQQETPANVTVSCAFPGGVRTDVMRNGLYAPTADRAGIVERFDGVIARISPDAAAEAILRGSGLGRRRIIVGADAQVANALSRIAGSRYQVLTRRLGAGRT